MSNKRGKLVISVLVLAALIGDASQVAAQSGTTGSSTTQSQSAAMTDSEFQASFWKYLTEGKLAYTNWTSWPGRNGIYPGQSPHGAFLKLYANRTAAFNPAELPHGSILVKENYGEDRETLMAVTVMYRSKGYDAAHRDWYWIKYNPDGTVATTPSEMGSKPIAGRFSSCIECHSSADGGDLSFAND